MDKRQIDQLNKLVMDLDKSLTRLKSFVDQNENANGIGNGSATGFGDLDDNFGFPPLPSRRSDPFGARSARSNTPSLGFDDPMGVPLNAPMAPPRRAAPPFGPPLGGATPTSSRAQAAGDPFLPTASPVPLAVPAASTTNTVLSPTVAAAITDEVEGTFDGQFLVSPSGQKVEVPANYASKSRVLFGDTVKSYKEAGEQKFKVTTKQPRKKLKALTTKRGGKWYVISGLGSYKIADSAAEFNNLRVNQEVNVLIPENNTTVPFATFDEVYTAPQQPAPVANTNSASNNNASRSQQSQQGKNAMQQQKPVNKGDNTADKPKPTGNASAAPTQPPTAQQPPVTSQAPADPAARVVEDFDLV